MEHKIDFEDPMFQFQLVALMLENPAFLDQYKSALYPELWTAEELQLLVRLIGEFHDRYRRPPTHEELKRLCRDAPHSPIVAETWDEVVDALAGIKGNGNLAFVHDSTVDWVRYHAYRRALELAADQLSEGDFDSIEATVRDAAAVSLGPDSGVAFWGDAYRRLSETLVREAVPTLIRPLDRRMGGGPAKGELTVVLATPGLGKTTMLVNLGVGAVLSGGVVYHFFAEQTEDLVWAKYASRFTRKSYSDLRTRPRQSARWLSRIQKKSGGELRICSCLGWTVDQVRSYVYRQGQPDVVVIDYADKLLPPRHYSDYRHEISRIYDELSAMAREWNCAVFTASQANAQALGREVVDIGNLAEATIAKAAVADNIIALCQTRAEEETGELRLFLAKVRNQEGRYQIPCQVFRDRCLIRAIEDLRAGRGVR